MIWTGLEVIVLGGGEGFRYSPLSNTWSLLLLTNAPSARTFHTAISTGTGMLVWGGHYFEDANEYILDDGAYYLAYLQFYLPLCMK